VGLQPVGQRSGLTAGQDVDRPPSGGIDQNGGVDVPAAQREVIDTQHFWRCPSLRIWQVDNQPQQRATVHCDTQRPSQPGSRPPGQLQRNLG